MADPPNSNLNPNRPPTLPECQAAVEKLDQLLTGAMYWSSETHNLMDVRRSLYEASMPVIFGIGTYGGDEFTFTDRVGAWIQLITMEEGYLTTDRSIEFNLTPFKEWPFDPNMPQEEPDDDPADGSMSGNGGNGPVEATEPANPRPSSRSHSGYPKPKGRHSFICRDEDDDFEPTTKVGVGSMGGRASEGTRGRGIGAGVGSMGGRGSEGIRGRGMGVGSRGGRGSEANVGGAVNRGRGVGAGSGISGGGSSNRGSGGRGGGKGRARIVSKAYVDSEDDENDEEWVDGGEDDGGSRDTSMLRDERKRKTPRSSEEEAEDEDEPVVPNPKMPKKKQKLNSGKAAKLGENEVMLENGQIVPKDHQLKSFADPCRRCEKMDWTCLIASNKERACWNCYRSHVNCEHSKRPSTVGKPAITARVVPATSSAFSGGSPKASKRAGMSKGKGRADKTKESGQVVENRQMKEKTHRPKAAAGLNAMEVDRKEGSGPRYPIPNNSGPTGKMVDLRTMGKPGGTSANPMEVDVRPIGDRKKKEKSERRVTPGYTGEIASRSVSAEVQRDAEVREELGNRVRDMSGELKAVKRDLADVPGIRAEIERLSLQSNRSTNTMNTLRSDFEAFKQVAGQDGVVGKRLSAVEMEVAQQTLNSTRIGTLQQQFGTVEQQTLGNQTRLDALERRVVETVPSTADPSITVRLEELGRIIEGSRMDMGALDGRLRDYEGRLSMLRDEFEAGRRSVEESNGRVLETIQNLLQEAASQSRLSHQNLVQELSQQIVSLRIGSTGHRSSPVYHADQRQGDYPAAYLPGQRGQSLEMHRGNGRGSDMMTGGGLTLGQPPYGLPPANYGQSASSAGGGPSWALPGAIHTPESDRYSGVGSSVRGGLVSGRFCTYHPSSVGSYERPVQWTLRIIYTGPGLGFHSALKVKSTSD
ncbi:hypothetical protein DFP72DRAFT_1084023 [Ephemerocybe angulata]|uniref:Uncharacterized protein n=1 Tax=Ephemerocybe angulata TaxID=980116 RepID=A0A8H6H8C9_9AGAR|nr:hypothetical protein DFP72DRAFT_1084023 [Tulosesus angulatus]